jgi:hypothetical protein
LVCHGVDPSLSLKEIAQLARLAHYWQVFPVSDRLGVKVIHAFESLRSRGEMPSKSLYVAAFALWPQGDEPLELGDYFWFAFPRFYFGLSEAERAPFARYAGAMLERFLRRAERKEDLRHVALLLHRLHFPAPAPDPAPCCRIVDGIRYCTHK